jgi:hypothetical protein
MLDVHPPHESAHTWKDFWLHIATIVVGLLIAIGLEQTVEAIHHARDRRELIADLHGECARNMKTIEYDVDAYDNRRDWLMSAAAALGDAKPEAGFITVTLPARERSPYPLFPARAVWLVAKTNGKAALLPDNLAAVYERMDYAAGEYFRENEQVIDAARDTSAAGVRLHVRVTPGSRLHLSVQSADVLSAAFAHEMGAENDGATWVSYWGADCQAILDGVKSRDAMSEYILRARERAKYE